MKKIFTLFIILLFILGIVFFVKSRSSLENTEKNANIANIKTAQEEKPVENNNITVITSDTDKKFSINNSSSAYIASEISDSKVILRIKESAKDILLVDGMSGNVSIDYTVSKLKSTPSKVVAGQLNNLASYPIILVISEDGNVENINSEKGFKTGKFESTGYIDSLQNIVDIIPVTVEFNNSTYLSLLAIDQNNNAYEITQDMLN